MVTTGVDRRDVSNSVGLLISILVRYPEVGTIKFDPKLQTLSFTFLLRSVPNTGDDGFAACLHESLEAYSVLEGLTMTTVSVVVSSDDGISTLEVTRDVASLTQTELALIVELVLSRFQSQLIVDDNESLVEEDLLAQDELIQEMLADLQDGRMERNLIAFRDGGRVLVFNK